MHSGHQHCQTKARLAVNGVQLTGSRGVGMSQGGSHAWWDQSSITSPAFAPTPSLPKEPPNVTHRLRVYQCTRRNHAGLPSSLPLMGPCEHLSSSVSDGSVWTDSQESHQLWKTDEIKFIQLQSFSLYLKKTNKHRKKLQTNKTLTALLCQHSLAGQCRLCLFFLTPA